MPIRHGWKTRTRPVQESVQRNDPASRITGCSKGGRFNMWDIYVCGTFILDLRMGHRQLFINNTRQQ